MPVWPAAWRWALLGIALICLLLLYGLILTAAMDKGIQIWARWLLLATLIGSLAAALVTSEFTWERASRIQSIIEPRNVALVFLAGLVAFGAMTDAVGLFAPRPAIEDRPYEIRDAARTAADNSVKILERISTLPPPARIRSAIVGRWGEQDSRCALVWNFEVRGDALIAEIVKRPVGFPPFKLVAAITTVTGDDMAVVSEEPEPGFGADFRYRYDGATERLLWDDKARRSGFEEYRRC